jgi:hypothetical protein
MLAKNRALSAVGVLTALFVFAACFGRGPLEVTLTIGQGRPSRSLHTFVGATLLDTVLAPSGGTEYVSPPTLTGASVAFVDVSCSAPSESGCGQVFRFTAVATGQTIVTYHNSGEYEPSADVVDTVIVH